MTRTVVLDFETRSTVELGRGGTNAWNYAGHRNTGVWVACWAYDDDPDTVYEWRPDGNPEPLWQLFDHINSGGTVSAHNAEFEYAIINNHLVPWHGWPAVTLRQLDDTAARGARCGYPRALDKMPEAMGLEVRKDKAGAALMKRMAKPRKVNPDGSLVWWDVPDRVAKLVDYCRQDVRTQMQLHLTLPPLPPAEWANWQATLRANARGVMLDVPFITRAEALIQQQLSQYARELLDLTNGAAKSHSDLNGMKAFLARAGYPLDSLDKNVVAGLLADPNTPDTVRRVVSIRSEAGKSSVAKYPAMRLHADEDGIARQQMVYYGAQATGRLSGQGIQLQNLPARGAVGWEEAEWHIDNVLRSDLASAAEAMVMLADGSPIEVLSMCLRGAITARPGMDLVVADYSNIEGRMAAWLGGEQWKLDAFRRYDAGTGPDLYKVTAASIVGGDPYKIDKTTRNVMGKVPELALGFGGGVGAFVDMGATYGVVMDHYVDLVRANVDSEFWGKAVENFDSFGSTAKCTWEAWVASEAIKLAWRSRHPGIAQAWRDCEDGAIAAVAAPGSVHTACGGKLAFRAEKMGGRLALLMRLPSGRCLYYQNATLREQKTPWGAVKQELRFDKVEQGRVIRSGTYGGDIFQSAVQGSARDVMMAGWLNVDAKGYAVLFSVHDELVAEYPAGQADLDEYKRQMCHLPQWAAGLPVAATGYVGKRFRKD